MRGIFVKEIFTEISIGAEKPFEILHVSDTHLAFAGYGDNDRKRELAAKRIKDFPDSTGILDRTVLVSREKGIPVMNTGDLIDFVSDENLRMAEEFNTKTDVFTCAGNHEFSQYVGEAWEDEAYRNQSLERVQASYRNDIRFSSRIINGVCFAALDNSYYLVEQWQLEKLKAEVGKGLPVVLMIHVPLYAPDIFGHMINTLHNTDAGLMAAPEELISFYSDYRFRQQRGDEITREAYDYIVNEPGISLVLTGHLHFDFVSVLPGGKRQLITGKDTLRTIRFI